MGEHTPGPWGVEVTDTEYTDYDVVSFDGTLITCPADRENPREYKANAYLMAAAPEMREALEVIAAMDPCTEAQDIAAEALAKARGEA